MQLLTKARARVRRALPKGHHEDVSIVSLSSGLPAAAERAASDDAAFASFRTDPDVVEIVETVTREQGAAYLALLEQRAPHLLEDRYRRSDDAGGPATFDYGGHGRWAPTTLRYLKAVADLEREWGDLGGMRVVEIGGGYGGQARAVVERWPGVRYSLVDLDPVVRLAGRYLDALGCRVSLVPASAVPAMDSDLVVSAYAFTEMGRALQAEYVEKVVGRASRGFVTCNFIGRLFGVDSMSREELGAMREATRWLPEEPLTHPDNAILTWG